MTQHNCSVVERKRNTLGPLAWLALALTLPLLKSFLTTAMSSSSFTVERAASIMAV